MLTENISHTCESISWDLSVPPTFFCYSTQQADFNTQPFPVSRVIWSLLLFGRTTEKEKKEIKLNNSWDWAEDRHKAYFWTFWMCFYIDFAPPLPLTTEFHNGCGLRVWPKRREIIILHSWRLNDRICQIPSYMCQGKGGWAGGRKVWVNTAQTPVREPVPAVDWIKQVLEQQSPMELHRSQDRWKMRSKVLTND